MPFEPFQPASPLNQGPLRAQQSTWSPDRLISEPPSGVQRLQGAQYSGSAPRGTYYAGEGTLALMDLKAKLQSMFLGWLGYRAGKNAYEIFPSVEHAAIHGATALRRWWVWLGFVQLWILQVLFVGWCWFLKNSTLNGESFNDTGGNLDGIVRGGMIFIIPAFVLAVLIPYSRAIDFSFFKRNFVYWMVRPLAKLLTPIPNWMLYLSVFAILAIPVG